MDPMVDRVDYIVISYLLYFTQVFIDRVFPRILAVQLLRHYYTEVQLLAPILRDEPAILLGFIIQLITEVRESIHNTLFTL